MKVENFENIVNSLALEAVCTLMLGKRMGFLSQRPPENIAKLASSVRDTFIIQRDTSRHNIYVYSIHLCFLKDRLIFPDINLITRIFISLNGSFSQYQTRRWHCRSFSISLGTIVPPMAHLYKRTNFVRKRKERHYHPFKGRNVVVLSKNHMVFIEGYG